MVIEIIRYGKDRKHYLCKVIDPGNSNFLKGSTQVIDPFVSKPVDNVMTGRRYIVPDSIPISSFGAICPQKGQMELVSE